MTARQGPLPTAGPMRARPPRLLLLAGVSACLLAAANPARADIPLNYLVSAGARANHILPLTWGVSIISVLVVVILSGLLLWAILRRRGGPPTRTFDNTPASRGGDGLRWISWGVGLSSIVLFATVIWTIRTVARVMEPDGEPAITLEVIAHQWWWEVRYPGAMPSQGFTTANEIHIPVGQPVRIRLKGADVIHSFWVPLLAGKTDVIPGTVNTTWMTADAPGTYRGQCTEYCGVEHANMGFLVIAQPRPEFDAWRRAQASSAAPPARPRAREGEAHFKARCGACHSVRGTGAGGRVGPDLTHLMSRQTLAAATIPNTPDTLARWIAHAQDMKPRSLMPNIRMPEDEHAAITAYLQTLE